MKREVVRTLIDELRPTGEVLEFACGEGSRIPMSGMWKLTSSTGRLIVSTTRCSSGFGSRMYHRQLSTRFGLNERDIERASPAFEIGIDGDDVQGTWDTVGTVEQPELAGSLRDRFSVTNDDLLGFGGEAAIYALDEQRVVRCYRAGTDRRRVEVRAAFYEGIARSSLPFKLPAVESIGVVDGWLYSIEERIPGTSLTTALGMLEGTERSHALSNYAAAAEHIQSIELNDHHFGELLADAPIRRRTWPAFLVDRAERALFAGRRVMKADVQELDDVLATFRAGTAGVSDVVEPRLVHGDYFPGNVMVDARGGVTGILDFSPMTVAGDPRLDLAGALLFLEVVAPYRPEDSTTVEDVITARHGQAVLPVIELYRTYYSLYFSATKEFDPELYRWCVNNLTKRDHRPGSLKSRSRPASTPG